MPEFKATLLNQIFAAEVDNYSVKPNLQGDTRRSENLTWFLQV